MRRQPTLLLVLLIVILALSSTRDGVASPSGQIRPPLVTQIDGSGDWRALDVEPLEQAGATVDLAAGSAAADDCEQATVIPVFPFGGATITNSAGPGIGDAPLACMWGDPVNAEGNRTVWYKFTAKTTSNVHVDTTGSTYDTVVAVYQASGADDSCSALIQIACDDDSHFFSSRVIVPVRAGVTYLIEVADWKLLPNADLTLAFSAWTSPIDSRWEVANADYHISRHVALPVGDKLYVIGGYTADVLGNPSRSGRTRTYDTKSGQWQELAPMPALGDLFGYANTTAVYVDSVGKIFVPSGDVANQNGVYEGNHRVYDIGSNSWSVATNNLYWPGGNPAAYSAAAPGSTNLVQVGYYLAGGLIGPFPEEDDSSLNWTARKELYYYGVDLNTWFLISDTMPTARFAHTAARQFIGGQEKFCVAGGVGRGQDSLPTTLGSVECFDVDAGNWSTVASLNFPRHFAGSAVDGYGNWVIFGGVDGNGLTVGPVEWYDRDSNAWIVLDIEHDLTNPALGWPRGGFVGDTLWSVGGEDMTHDVVSEIQKMKPTLISVSNLQPELYMPLIQMGAGPDLPGSTFARAKRLPLNVTHSQAFKDAADDVDVYAFDLISPRTVEVMLTSIPLGSNYDLYVYDSNKLYLTPYEGRQPGSLPEVVSLSLSPDRYYVVIKRVLPVPGAEPNPQSYQIAING